MPLGERRAIAIPDYLCNPIKQEYNLTKSILLTINYQFMKKNLFSLLAFGALTFGLVGCSNDEPNGGQVNNGEAGDGIGYMAFRITNSENSRSRADGELTDGGQYGTGDDKIYDGETFNSGDAAEYAIVSNEQANLALFYMKTANAMALHI